MSFVAGSGQGNCIFPYFGLELIKTLLLYFNSVLDIILLYPFKFFRHSGVPGGKQSPVTVGAGYQGDPSAMANRPLAELCKLLLLFE